MTSATGAGDYLADVHAGTLQQQLIAFREVHHLQMFARLLVALVQALQCRYRGMVSHVQVATVEHHARRVCRGCEQIQEVGCRCEEQRAMRAIRSQTSFCVVDVGADVQCMLPCEGERSNNNAAQDSRRQVGENGNDGHGDNHQRILRRDLAEHP